MQTVSAYKKRISKVRWVISFAVMLPLVTVWLLFLSGRWRSFEIVSASMDPTLQVGDLVLMQSQQHVPDLTGKVIVFADPKGESDPLTKRVIAGQFTAIRLRNGHVYLGDDKYPIPGETLAYQTNHTWNVGEDEVFVMGDNRNDSFDSVEFGPIKRSSITGVVTLRYWPPHRIGFVR